MQGKRCWAEEDRAVLIMRVDVVEEERKKREREERERERGIKRKEGERVKEG